MALSRKCSAFVYLLLCADGSIYTGWTFDVARRLQMHQNGRGARYTRTRAPLRLLYQERLPSRQAAMLREAEIKRWPRSRKLKLAKKNTEPRTQNTEKRRHKAKRIRHEARRSK